MENGTIWGHGAYLGPDFRRSTCTPSPSMQAICSRGSILKSDMAGLDEPKKAIVLAMVRRVLKENRYISQGGNTDFCRRGGTIL